ncbi:MAG: AAA family ATPase [Verrucomicrobiota bacterium]
MLDDGRITDGQGRTVDFRNTVIIMTSNIGSDHILNESDADNRQLMVREALRGHFRPEFLNRVDETVIFDRLSAADLRQIVAIQIQRVQKRLADQKLTLELSDQAMEFLANSGYDPVYGARPLKRAIQKLILDPLSMQLLDGNFVEGDRVYADLTNGAIDFKKAS